MGGVYAGKSFVRCDTTCMLRKGQRLMMIKTYRCLSNMKGSLISNICYRCGCLMHNDQDCEAWIDSEGTLTKLDREYGPWLRASPMIGTHKSVVSMPGFYSKKGGTTSD